MKPIGLLSIGLLAAGFIAVNPAFATDAKPGEKPESKAEQAVAETPAKLVPYHGKVLSVDSAARSFTLNGKAKERLVRTTDKTAFVKDGKPSDFAAITVGEIVRGQASKVGDAWEAKKVIIGPKNGAPEKSEEKK